MSLPSSPTERAAQALLVALGALKKQNDHDLIEMNAALAQQNEEMKKYCSSISAIADIVVQMKTETEENKQTVRDVGDSLIMLWGQLAANGVVFEERQRTRRVTAPVLPAAPVNGVSAEITLTELWCSE